MLERVLILPQKVELGSLAEALTYYGHVEVAYQRGHIAELVERLGIDSVIRIAESDLVTFVYRRSMDAVRTDDTALYPHSFVCITFAASAEGRRINTVEDEVAEAIDRRLGRGTVGRRDLRRLADAMVLREEYPEAISKGALADVSNPDFLQRAIRIVLARRVPSYPKADRILARARVSEKYIYLDSNVDFILASNLLREFSGVADAKLTPAQLLTPLLNVRSEMIYSGDRRCDIWADDTHSDLFRAKVNSFMSRLVGGRSSIDRFEEFAFAGRSFSEAVECGERSLIDVLEFAEARDTRRFKQWIKNGPDGGDLLAEYEKSRVAPSQLAASLPVKAAKMVLFAGAGVAIEAGVGGAGVVGAVAGNLVGDATLSVADKLLGSHLSLGWKPNQWVTKSANPFLRG
ncbi:hypothetical protein [Phenylobacterium sp.]|uniref:hypothetical protein n=1 Tax=Phenylobacterium sp. TaxID=1871053 RepID=UPI002730DFEB|nr:hypothetical protein [Phenylobacterium sp.]MDP2212964.1 hypothetical protein [Phenylobacterium sp.]